VKKRKRVKRREEKKEGAEEKKDGDKPKEEEKKGDAPKEEAKKEDAKKEEPKADAKTATKTAKAAAAPKKEATPGKIVKLMTGDLIFDKTNNLWRHEPVYIQTEE